MSKPYCSSSYIGMGGNEGNTRVLIKQAIQALGCRCHTRVCKVSSFYRSSAVGFVHQRDFINAVALVETSLCAPSFQLYLQEIEKHLGKNVLFRNGPRSIDLDILFFGQERRSSPTLNIPHPLWQERLFVLKPLFELAPFITMADPSGEIKKIDLAHMLYLFPNPHQEKIELLTEFSYNTT